jgi:hypothetical protein
MVGSPLLPIRVEAQTIPSPYRFIEGRHSIGLIGGPFSMGRGELRLGPGSGTAVGAVYGIEVKGPLALEANVLAIRADREIYRPTSTQTIDSMGSVTPTLVGAEIRLRFTLTGQRTWNGLAPYLFGGGGMVTPTGGRTEIEAEFNDAQYLDFERKGVWSVGAGTRWYPTPKIGIRAEATYRTWVIEVPTAFSLVTLPSGLPPSEEERLGGLSLTVGATFGL